MKHDFTVVEGIDMMLCKEGTTFWALAQMKKGFKVWQPEAGNIFKYDELLDYPVRQLNKENNLIGFYKESLFMEKFSHTFEIYREAKFKAGDWIRNIYSNAILYVEKIDHTNYKYFVRLLGCKSIDEQAFSAINAFYKPYSLEPDFSEAKVGDKIFAYGFGEGTILKLMCEPYPIKAGKSSEEIGGFETFTNEGKTNTADLHPSLFHSYEQAENYYKEVIYQDRLKDETDSN